MSTFLTLAIIRSPALTMIAGPGDVPLNPAIIIAGYVVTPDSDQILFERLAHLSFCVESRLGDRRMNPTRGRSGES